MTLPEVFDVTVEVDGEDETVDVEGESAGEEEVDPSLAMGNGMGAG